MAKPKTKESNKTPRNKKYTFDRKTEDGSHGLMKDIFKDEQGKKLDMTKMERKSKNWKKIIIILLIVFLFLAVGASAIGYMFFNKAENFEEEGIELSYTGPTQVVSGEEFTLKINFKNNEPVTLSDMLVEVQYPEGFTYLSSNFGTTGQYNNQWRFSSLLSGQSKTLEVTGQVIGDVGSSLGFSSVWEYQPINFNSEFRKNIDWQVVITSSTIELELKGPREAIPDQEVSYQLNYENSSSRDLQRVKIIADWPEGFTLQNSDPEINNTSWQVNSLSAGEKDTIDFSGTFSGESGSSSEIIIQIGLIQSDGSVKIQLEKSFLILLIKPQLQLSVELNGETGVQAFDWGETLTYTIEVNNAGDVKLDQVEATLVFEAWSNGVLVEAEFLDWTTLINPQGADQLDNSLVWDSDAIESLGSLKPSDEIDIMAEVNLLNQPPSDVVGQKNFELKAKLEFAGQRISTGEDGAVSFDTTSELVTAQINTQPDVKFEARYYDSAGEAIGLGPIPPQVGEATVYKIFWYLQNTSNDLLNVTVSTTLPKTVSWTGQGTVSAGEPLSYDSEDRMVSWTINKVPAYTGLDIDQLVAEFSVSVIPTRTQLNENILLTDKTVFQATDSLSNDIIVISRDAQSTSLTFDEYGRGQGKVIGQGS